MREILCLLVGLSIQTSFAYCTMPCQDFTQYEQAIGVESWRPFITLKNAGTTQIVSYDLSQWTGDQELSMILPYAGTDYEINVSAYNIYTANQQITRSIKHYRGKIQGDNNSHVQLSIGNDHISGKIVGTGIDIIIQPNQYKGQLEFFNTKSRQSPDWECGTSELEGYYDELANLPYAKSFEKNNSMDTVTIYAEVDHHVYSLFNNSEGDALDYTETLLASVADLYYQENIVLLFTDINVWTVPTPYSDASSLDAIKDFKNQLGSSYGADLAHLISGNPAYLGGVAYLNGICDKNKSYGYSNIHGDYQNGASYHWDVHVIAHEIGHNLGSPHTHDCVWGPNKNTSIDACVDKGCGDNIPASGGTIMSYCHQSNVGVDLTNGFSPEPAALMRAVLSTCNNDLPTTCEKSTELIETGIYTVQELKGGFGATEGSAQHAAWYKFIADKDGFISGGSCDMGVDTRLYLYQGSCDDLVKIHQSDDNCHSANGLFYASYFDSIPILEGESYFIEWDDRWSSKSFDFTFKVDYETIEHCYNNIQDGDETGVDCGGSSCMPCCTSNLDMSPIVMESTTLITNEEVYVDSKVMAPSTVIICSGTTIEFEAGFDLEPGAVLSAQIEDCMN